jgi:acetyltransferase-like isoleucine patch superfamily enzyme
VGREDVSSGRVSSSPPRREIHECGPELPSFARFGAGSKIYAPFLVSCADRIYIGENVHISHWAYLSVADEYLGRRYDPHLIIADGAMIGSHCVIACIGRIEIGPGAALAQRVYVGDTYHDYQDPHTAIMMQPMAEPEPVKIEAGAFVGVGSAVMPGVTIGERAFIAANTVVTEDVPPNTVFAGNPGRVIKRWDPDSEAWVSPDLAPPPAPKQVHANGALAVLEQRLSLTEAEKLAREDEIKALKGRLAEAERLRAATEHWLEDHRKSVSWRLTAPLRSAKRAVTRRSPR